MLGRNPTMNPSQSSRKAFFKKTGFRIPGALGVLAVLGAFQALGGLSGCESVNIDSGDTDTTKVTVDSAVIRVTNDISQDPDSLTLLLFSPNAVDWTNSNFVKRLGGVPEGGTADIKVPAGIWKLAYEKGAGIRVPMEDVNAGAGEWLKSIFVKDGKYALILRTDVNETVWVPSFETDPPIE
jgi:hypothetical protein